MKVPSRRVVRFDRFTGPHAVNGVFRVDGQVSLGTVFLFERSTGLLARRTTTSENGVWSFERMMANSWFVLARSHSDFRAAVVDNVVTQ